MRFIFPGLCSVLLLLPACGHKDSYHGKPLMIRVQPFTGLDPVYREAVVKSLTLVYPQVKLLPPIDLPSSAYYPARNRYRADSLIDYLDRRTPDGSVTIGLTQCDISVTNGKMADWGVMGYGYQPGSACVASLFRLSGKKRSEQFFKIAIHELGHTQGLPHCPVKTCFMRDAEGHNPTDEEKGFCEDCRQHLEARGWQFEGAATTKRAS